jgi:uncharacterized RDD family membrane protein YckC
MALLQVKTSFNIDLQFETAPFHLRLFAWIIDFIFLYVFLWFMGWALDRSVSIDRASEFGLTEIFITTPFILYHVICELFLNGQSIGKKLLGIQVVSLNGQSASASQYILRWLLRFIDFGMMWSLVFFASSNILLGAILLIGSLTGFVVFISSKYNQRFGDIVAGTTVVLKKLPYKLSDTIFQDLDVKSYNVVFPDVMRLSDKDLNIINNILNQHYKSNIHTHLNTVANKIKSLLNINTDMEDEMFLETLMRDYNYLSRK